MISGYKTVLPGRIARMNAALSLQMLSLKQVFVRYVSHEIRYCSQVFYRIDSIISTFNRSPLNVVHAGLDILRDELRQLQAMENSTDLTIILNSSKCFDKIKELVEDIFAASDSAINILNDLLDYEHMDAGWSEVGYLINF